MDREGLHAFEALAQGFDAHGADDVEVIIDDGVSYIVHKPFRHRDGLERDLVVYLLQNACPELEWFLFEVLDHLDHDALFGELRVAEVDVELGLRAGLLLLGGDEDVAVVEDDVLVFEVNQGVAAVLLKTAQAKSVLALVARKNDFLLFVTFDLAA